MKRKFNFAIALLAMLALVACREKKDLLYVTDMEPGHTVIGNVKHEAVIQPGDRLRIEVTSKNPELAVPFNVKSVRVGADGQVTAASNGGGYRVDVDGNIDFPILGTLHVQGMTTQQVRDMIRKDIIAGDYIKNPIVDVDLLNLRYTVLGAIGSNGTFSAEDGKINLLQAIANAGDISANGRIDNVKVIREEDGGRTVYTHDLSSSDIFSSPCFYLQQNDIVYVEPKFKKNSTEDYFWRYATFILSLSTAVCSILWVTKK